MHVFFYHIYCWVQRHKVFAVMLSLLFLLGFGFLGSRIQFEEEIPQISPQNRQADLVSKGLQQVNFADKITVLIERDADGKPEDMLALADTFLDTLDQDTTYIREVRGEMDGEVIGQTYDFVYAHLPLFLDVADYDTLERRIAPEAIAEQVALNYEELMTPTSFVTGDFIQKDPLGFGWIGLQKFQELSVGDSFSLYEGFISNADTTQLLLLLSPMYEGTEAEQNEALADFLYGIQDELNATYNGQASISYFGSALVAAANAEQIKTDIFKTVAISMSVLMLLLILFYRKIYIPLLVFIPTVFSAVFALGCLYLYKPVISAISLSIAAVLIGITIDYALHILTHFKKNADAKTVYKELTRPLLMSGTTNAVVFICLLFVHSTALVDLGIFASLALISSAVFTLLIVPHLYKTKKELKHNSVLDKLAAFPFERSKPLIAICVVLIVVSLFTSHKVQFNDDLAGLNYMPNGLAETEARLDELMNTSAKSLYVVATGGILDTALQRNAALSDYLHSAEEEGIILDYSGVESFMPPHELQQAKIDRWNAFWEKHDVPSLVRTIQSEGAKYGFEEDAHQAFYGLLQQPFHLLTVADFAEVPHLGIGDFVSENEQFYTVSTLVKIDEEHRAEVVKKLEDTEGVIVVDRKHLNETFLGKLRDDFNNLVGYSSVAVLLILWLFFRRLELVLLAAIPIGLTGLVTAGMMGLFGLEFNIFSAIVCTLVFGHGVDFSIFMTAALQKQYTTGKDSLQVFRTSILLAVLTTVLAIGALIFAKHPALISISSVSLIGVMAAVLITFVFYPIIFRFFISNRAKQGKSPFTIWIALWSIALFIYYGLGCWFLSFVVRFILPILPSSSAKKDTVMRRWISRFMKSVLYGYPLVKNDPRNPYGETFEKPAVVIANHASFLDTLTITMMMPKVVYLVNDWVWKSPVFGRAVRALGFYPVNDGVTESHDTLREKIKQGYSIVVFPEGTRSYDNVPKRFHKGAFYLAEQLQLDIVPFYIHGNGDVLPKGDIMIFPGRLSPVIGQRIAHDDRTYGQSYTERTKCISKYFKSEYENWRLQLEDADYFIKKINLAYLYKDDEIQDAVESSLARWKNLLYKLSQERITDGDVLHLSDSYGELDYLLSLQQGKRKVIGLIVDDEKRAVADSIYWRQLRAVSFTQNWSSASVLLISKALTSEEIAQIPWDDYEKVVSVHEKNDLDFVVDKGFRREVIDETLVYVRG